MKHELATKDAAQFPEMGRQLTLQYDRAVGGIRDVLIFGAMMLQLRAVISSARGQVHPGGANSKDTGINGWLNEYAPKVSRPTAYRFMDLAEGIRDEFKLGAKVDLQHLLTTDPKKLEPALAKKRAAILEFVEDKSQRQLLFSIGKSSPQRQQYHATRKDGSARAERRTKDEIDEAYARGVWDDELKGELGRWADERLFERLDDKRLTELNEILMSLTPAVRTLAAQRRLKS